MASRSANSLSSLLQLTDLDDHEEILKAANETLKRSKSDMHAQQIRAIALLKLDRYNDALRAFEEAGDPLKKQTLLPYAYTLYKNGQLERAAEVALAGGGGTKSSKHIQAQVAYRLEDFQLASKLYAELSGPKFSRDSEGSDLRINSGATDAQLAWAGQGHLARTTKADRDDLEQFETAFNAACGYVARGNIKQAELLLKKATDLCNAADELSDSEKMAELLPITVQQIYVLSTLGKVAEAERLCASLKISDISDQTTRYIAQANVLAASEETSNPYLAHRLLSYASKVPTKDLPFHFQATALQRNHLALDLKVGKTSRVAGSTLSTITSASPGSVSPDVTSAGVFNAVAHAHSQTVKSALKEILPLLERRPTDVGLLLTIVQLYIITNNLNMATSLLENFFARLESTATGADLDTRFAPGLIALLVSLNGRLNRPAQVKAELARAASHWRHKSKDSPSSAPLFKAAGTALLESPTAEDLRNSHEVFAFLHDKDPTDRVAIAGLAASAWNDATAPQNIASKLLTIKDLTAGIDAATLEEAGIARPETTKKRPAPAGGARAEKPKKARKTKLPKNYDASKQPDPERWLPLRDRSNWRPRGKKKGRAIGGGMATQGGLVNEDSRPATPTSQVLHQAKQGGAKRKKGKVGK